MVRQTEQEESTIDQAMKLLVDKHNAVPEEQYCHYVVKGEDEQECDSEDYCEDCIESAIRDFKDRWYCLRGLERNRAMQIAKNGYVIYMAWNDELEGRGIKMQKLSDKEAKRYCRFVKTKYTKEPEPIFSYRYYQKDSDTSTRSCNKCGKKINVCVTADEQEIEHWESFEDTEFLIPEMSDDTAYDLYEVLQFIHQANEGVYKRGVLIAEKILSVNQAQRNVVERSVATKFNR